MTLKVGRARRTYTSALKYGILSRSNKSFNGNTLKPDKAVPITYGA